MASRSARTTKSGSPPARPSKAASGAASRPASKSKAVAGGSVKRQSPVKPAPARVVAAQVRAPASKKAAAAGKAAGKGAIKTKVQSQSRDSGAKSKALEAPRSASSKSVGKAVKTNGAEKKVKTVLKNATGKARAETSSIVLPEGYRPSEAEPFMNERHRAYFRRKLLTWKEEIIRQTRETIEGLHEDSSQHADLADRATAETDRALELRARDRQRKLISKIDAALGRIEDGTYGYCEETGEPISLKRLDARPIATLSIEAQERHERRERVYRED